MKKWYTLAALIILTLSLLLLSCSGKTSPAASSSGQTSPAPSNPASPLAVKATATPTVTPLYGGTFKWVRNAGLTTCGAPAEGDVNGGTTWTIFETLILLDAQGHFTTDPPALAESYEVSPDGKTITFHLRKNIKFSDGTEFNAAAVKYNLQQFVANNVSGSSCLKNVSSYDIVDNFTLRLNLTQYDATILYQLSGLPGSGVGYIASPTAMQKPTTPENKAQDHTVGTGPFIFDSWSRDTYVKVKKNPNYWQPGKPHLDAIEYRNGADVTVSIMSLKAGEVNMVENIQPVDGAALAKSGFYVATPPNVSFIHSVWPNSADANSPFANEKVREAVAYAIDRDAISQGIGMGYSKDAYQLATTNDPWYVPGLTERKYDPAQAKQLLTQAGYPNGFSCTFQTDSRVRKENMVAIMTNLQDIGIKTTVDMADVARYTSITQNGWNGILLTGFPNSNSFTSWLTTFNNPVATFPSVAKPNDWTSKWNAVVAQPDFDKRMAQMKDLMSNIVNQALIIPFVSNSPLFVTDGTLMDYGWDKVYRLDAASMWLQKK